MFAHLPKLYVRRPDIRELLPDSQDRSPGPFGNRRAIDIYEGAPNRRTVGGDTGTANLFATYPQDYMTDILCFYNEFIDAAVLLIVILAIGDRNNTPPPDGLNPLILLFLVTGLGLSRE